MGQVSMLPVADMAQVPLPVTHGRRGDYALGDVARKLRIHRLSPRTIIDQLRTMARHDAMPLPLNPRIRQGELLRGPASICRNSLWDAGSFDAWLESRNPAATVTAVASPALRDQLAARAAQLASL